MAAIHFQEVDHVPFWNLWTHPRDPFNRKDQLARIPAVLELGMDDMVTIDPPWRMHPDVATRTWREDRPGLPYQVIVKEYYTPKGTMRQELRTSEVYDGPASILGNWNISHGLKMLVSEPADLEKLPYLLQGPDKDQIEEFKEKARSLRVFADEHQVFFEGGRLWSGDAAVWLMNVVPLVYACVDVPEFVGELLEIIWRCTEERLSLLLDVGVDMVEHEGWYDTTDFWSVSAYRRFLRPILEREIQMAHEEGAMFRYIITKGVAPLLGDLSEMGMDVLWGIDPVQDNVDLAEVKRKLGGKVCVWGGMNSTVILGIGTAEEIRDAVTEAIQVMAPGGGFVLSAIDQILPELPWENVMIAYNRWKEMADDPMFVK